MPLDLTVREQLDHVALTRTMLDRIDWKARGLSPVVQSAVSPRTDSLLLVRDVILCHCGEPEQYGANVKAYVWRYPVHLTVLTPDPERGMRVCRLLHKAISDWPHEPGTDFGKVGAIPDNPGFAIVGTSDMASSKSVFAFACTKLVQAGAL